MSSIVEVNKTKDTILVGNECPFYSSVVRGMYGGFDPWFSTDRGETLLLI